MLRGLLLLLRGMPDLAQGLPIFTLIVGLSCALQVMYRYA